MRRAALALRVSVMDAPSGISARAASVTLGHSPAAGKATAPPNNLRTFDYSLSKIGADCFVMGLCERSLSR
jgi:hypothetical protein